MKESALVKDTSQPKHRIQQIKASLTQEGQYNHKSCQNHCALGEFLCFFQRAFFRRKSGANSSHRSAFLPHRASSSDDPASCRSNSDNPNSGPECASWHRTARTCRSFGRDAPTLDHFGQVPKQELPDPPQKNKKQNFNATLISPTSRGGNLTWIVLLRTGSARNFQHLEQKEKVHPPPAGAKTKQRRFDPDCSPLWWKTERAPDATREGVTSRDYAHNNLNRAVNCFHI